LIDKYLEDQADTVTWSNLMERISASEIAMQDENENIRTKLITSNHEAASLLRDVLSQLSEIESSLRVY
jgi:hypothetical protein